MPVRTANAEWKGDLVKGTGTISTESGVLKNVTYNFVSRFEQGSETNPEELIGAAHAACFSMALAHGLSSAGFKVNSVQSEDKVHVIKADGGFVISKIELSTVADVEGIDDETFQKHAEASKKGCPVSKALAGTEIVMTAKLK
jgi:osmotically inducible protein OsmC